MRKRLGRSGASIDLYYRFKPANPPHEKVKLLEIDKELTGRYMGQQVRGEFTDYVFEGLDGKVFSLPKHKALSDALDGVEAGLLVDIVYKGKKKLPGGKSFHITECYESDKGPKQSDESDPL